MDLDELVERWTVLDDERALVDAKHGASRLGFAVLLKHDTRHGWFPTGRAEQPDVGIEFVARQLQLPAVDIDAYEWVGRSIERHRAQIRQHSASVSAAWPMPSSSPRGLLSMSPGANGARSGSAAGSSRGVAATGWPIRRRTSSAGA
jgi:hypothetical protein